jgi:hypothetical protein
VLHSTAQHTCRILFLGNSYTYVNNLPQLVHDLAWANGDTVIYDSNTPGGYSLSMHFNDAASVAKIYAQPWDYVVLQAQSQEPAIDSAYVASSVFPFAHKLDSLIHDNDSCTQTVFYMTWGRKNGDASYCPQLPVLCTYAGMQGELRRRYLQMAYDNHAIVAPAGLAWREVIAANPAFDLYQADESHPSLHGSYLTACTFYASIFRRSPVGNSFTGSLPLSDAQLLQQKASAIVFDSLAVWNTLVYRPKPSYSAAGTGQSVTLTSTSVNANAVFWDFGGGLTSASNVFTHTFTSPGTYPFTLTATNNCFSDTLHDTLYVPLFTGLLPEATQNFSPEVFPNPCSGAFSVRGLNGERAQLRIFDLRGSVLFSGTVREQEQVEFPLSAGTYFLELVLDNQRAMRKLIIQE